MSAQPRILPHSIDAEEAVVGGLLFCGRAITQVADAVDAGDFYVPKLEAIYAAMVELDRRSSPIDMITVAEEMRRIGTFGKLAAVDGEAYLAELANKIATVENIAQHARIVRDKSTARKLILVGSGIVEQGYGDQLEVDEYLDRAQQNVYDVGNRSARQSYVSITEVLHQNLRDLQHRYEAKSSVTGVPTGYSALDNMTAGLQGADLVLIAARPSMGKTALAINFAHNAAIGHNIPSLIFSLEMKRKSISERMLSREAQVDSHKLRIGRLTTKDWAVVGKAADRISRLRISIDDGSAPTINEMRARARRWRSDARIFPSGPKQLGLVVVDYLQLARGSGGRGRDQNREQEINEISQGLKNLAKDLNLPVVALSQLNRKVDERHNKRPMLSDLRESGALEQHADLILFVYRDEIYNKDSKDKGIAEIIIGKQRMGRVGTVRLSWLEAFTAFENLSDREVA